MSQNTQMDKRLLDRIAAERAQNIVDDAIGGKVKASEVDNLVTKALGVLQENGVYACFLFLFSRPKKDQDIAQVVREQLLELAVDDLPFEDWKKRKPNKPWGAETVLSFVGNPICAQLDPLLMTKEIFEQTLIYARYGAKAQKNEGR
jgi:hypothetical protein